MRCAYICHNALYINIPPLPTQIKYNKIPLTKISNIIQIMFHIYIHFIPIHINLMGLLTRLDA
ncbi:hypothetical protein GDO86_003066 [Hymenochirus boettgeri]|uniref:Uncharacterized protein n=1 Tax=Hymenochirus boettgeri TaxID=247094 RepID=A0A8T2JZS7_9PIPI|nr:hypothetical protein GDO86_003066 [Hymenochirus boettgeri]